jgi:hypothetical protein
MNSMFYGASSFQSDLLMWDIRNVVDMESMFERASSFSSNLFEWGNRLHLIGASAATVKVTNMFTDSACPVDTSPVNFEQGPWCTDLYTAVLSNAFN